MVKLGQSLVFGDTWEEIVGSQQSFSSGDHISRMIGLHEKVTSEQAGVSNELRFYVLGEFFTRTIQPTGPYDQPKILPETSRISPVNALKQKQQTVDDFFSEIFEEGISQNCSFAATEKFIDVYFNESSGSAFFDIRAYLSAFYHSLFELARCQTSREECEAKEPDYWQSFGCGAASALIEEGDIIGILESLSGLSRTVITNLFNCVKDGGAAYLILTSENADQRINEAFKCYLGLDISTEDLTTLYSNAQSYVSQNWDDPYSHGQATVFILSIAIPGSKITKARKLDLIDELAGRQEFKDVANDLRKLTDAVDLKDAKRLLDELAVKSVEDFTRLPLTKKFEKIDQAWTAAYPQIFFERRLFEDIMGHYRYSKNAGWGHTSDISFNFKGIDFYKGVEDLETGQIFTDVAVSMKTTITKDVKAWLGSDPMKKNIEFLRNGLSEAGLESNKKIMFIDKAEVHIYMPKDNITPKLRTEWMTELNKVDPDITFEIKALEDFIN